MAPVPDFTFSSIASFLALTAALDALKVSCVFDTSLPAAVNALHTITLEMAVPMAAILALGAEPGPDDNLCCEGHE